MGRLSEAAVLVGMAVAGLFLGQFGAGLSSGDDALAKGRPLPQTRTAVPTETTPGAESVWLPTRALPSEDVVPGGFYEITDISRSSTGDQLCFADKGDQVVWVLTSDLTVVHEVGGPGQGPGEFSDIHLQCAIGSSGTLVVYDHGYHRLSWFDGDGRLVDSMTADAPPLSRLMPDGSFVYDDGESLVWYDPVTDGREALPVTPGCQRVGEPDARASGWFALAPDWSWGLVLSHPSCANRREYEAILVESGPRTGRALSYPLIRELPDKSIGVTTSVILDDRAFVVHASAYDVQQISAVRVDVLNRDGELLWQTAIPRVATFQSAPLTDEALVLNDKREDRLLIFELAEDPNRPGEGG